MKTRVTMEENYTTLSAVYNKIEEKQCILNAVNEAISVFNLTPDVMIKPDSCEVPGKGRVIIEFRMNNRELGEFMDYIISCCNLEVTEK